MIHENSRGRSDRSEAFLEFGEGWDPRLTIAMAAGCATYFVFHLLARRRSRPLVAEKFTLPELPPIDKRLILSATLFGLGWGAAGVCPGPAITAALWNPSVLVFATALFAGVAIHEFTAAWFTRSVDLVDTNGPVWDEGMKGGKTD